MLLNDLKSHYESCQKQINQYDKMYPELILKYQKASADSLVFRMSLIEQNPRIIWRALEEYYGVNFFKKIIEIDFGVNDEEVQKKLKQKLKKF